MELHFGRATVRGAPKDLAEYTHELVKRGLLSFSDTDTGLPATPADQLKESSERRDARSGPQSAPPAGLPDPGTALNRAAALQTGDVVKFVQENPRANVETLTRHLLGVPIPFGGGYEPAYRKVANKLNHARKKLGIPAPSSVKEKA